MEDRVGRDGEAHAWDKDSTPASAKSYFLRVMKPSGSQTSIRNIREMHTLAVVLDHLALGRTRAAADVCAQRLKALEMAALTGSWERAQYIELVEQEGATLVDKEEEFIATKEVELHRRLHGHGGSPNSASAWRQDDAKGKGKDKGKYQQVHAKGKGKGKKDKGAGAGPIQGQE